MNVSAQGTKYGYSRRHRAAEIACIAGVMGLLVAFGVRIGQTIDSRTGWVALGSTIFVAYLASDALSGLVHWAGDTIGDEKVPFLGPNFVRPFREHHVDQKDIARHDFVETNGNNCIVIIGPLTLAFLLLPSHPGGGFFAATLVAFMSLFVVATNQFHKWAHTDDPPRVVRILQRMGLILSPEHHQKHHAVPHDRHYCITVGWMNPILNGLHFFRALEWLVARFRPTWLHLEERTRYAAEVLAASRKDAPAGTSGRATS
jgi:hypothetical protein